uniref:NAD(+) ADP-ribosyltransferase n=1 Tax=Megaselia scalaris TaxID=36166 RepID=T1H5C4_MEGSC
MTVDPGSGLESICKVFVSGNEKYSVVLGVTDLNTNRNAFYKIQLLVSEDERRFWIYRAWGRTGTSIGGDKTEGFANLERAQANFKATYFEKTGNEWENRHDFVKKPGLFYPIDISYAGDAKVDWESSKATSNLPKATQELIKLIFDIDSMKKTMLEFDLDMEKMPLGKLSKDQINKAFDVLNEISHYIKYGATEMDFIDASNRFYTLIPHNFGMRSPPILNELYQLNDLNSMLNTLLQIECAY